MVVLVVVLCVCVCVWWAGCGWGGVGGWVGGCACGWVGVNWHNLEQRLLAHPQIEVSSTRMLSQLHQ